MAIQYAEAPRRKHQQAGAREENPNDLDGEFSFRSNESGSNHSNEHWRRENTKQNKKRNNQRQQRRNSSGQTICFAPIAAGDQRRIYGNERSRKRAFAEQILKEIRDSKG